MGRGARITGLPGDTIFDGERPMPFDEDMRPDVQAVLNTSAMLEITEFEVFRLAYRDWFGRRPADATIEPFFTEYMFDDVVPGWVRHFTRRVAGLARQGALDPRSFGIDPRPFNAGMAARGLRYLILAVFWLTLLILLAVLAAQNLPEGGCYFPPCY